MYINIEDSVDGMSASLGSRTSTSSPSSTLKSMSSPPHSSKFYWKEFFSFVRWHYHQLSEWMNEKFRVKIDEKGKVKSIKWRKAKDKTVKRCFLPFSYPYHYQCYRYSSSPVEWNNLTRPILRCNHNGIRHYPVYIVHDVNIHFRSRLSSKKYKCCYGDVM